MELLSILFIGLFYIGTALCVAKVTGQYVGQQTVTPKGVAMSYATKEVLCHLYWNLRDTERAFNYCGESNEVFGFLQGIGRRISNALRVSCAIANKHRKKVAVIAFTGIAVFLYHYGGGSEMVDMLFGAAGLMGSPNPKDPNKKENTMNKLKSKVIGVYKDVKNGVTDSSSIVGLFNAIFNTAMVPFNSTGKDTSKNKGIPVFRICFKDNKPKVKHVKTKVPGSLKEKNLILDKICVMFGAGLKLTTLKYFHVEIPRDRIKSKHTMYNLMQFLATNDLVPFGSLKKDSKGRTKFYVLERWEAERYSRHTGDFLPYFHKILTDCKEVELLNVKVVDPAEFDSDGNVTKHNDLKHLNVDDHNDGCGFIRPSKSSSQFQAIPDGYSYDPDEVNDKFSEPAHDKMPIAKGYLDNNLVETDEEWNTAIGEEYDMVIFRKDQIKCFYEIAESGPWVVGFTWMNGRTIAYPFHWELTQFLELRPEVEAVLNAKSKEAIDDLFDRCSTREGLINYISEKVYNEMMSGYDTTIKMKVLAVLCSDLTHEFKWVKHQVESMILGDIWKITKSYGIFGEGIPLLTNDVKAETDPAYVPYEIADGVGGDNDGDYIVYLVNKDLRKMLYWRFPVVGGPVLRNIPDSLMDSLEDKHPEVVELFMNYMLDVPAFSRNHITKKRNERPLERALYTAWSIMDGEDIGINTNILKRLLSVLGEWDALVNATREKAIKDGESPDEAVARLNKWKEDYLIPHIGRAMICVESGAIALKYDVEGVEKPMVEKWITVTYPMFFAKLSRPTSWSKLADLCDEVGDDENLKEFDTRCYHYSMTTAVDKYNSWKSKTVPTRRMAESISLVGINMTLTNLDQAMEFLKEIGTAFRAVFEKYGDVKEGSDDAKLMAAELSLVVKHAERCGATLSLDVLKLACHEYLMHTKGTGASAIHMCGDRIFDVFGKHDSTPDNVKVELPEPKKGGIVLKAFMKGTDIPFDKIEKVIGTGKITGNTLKFSRIPELTISKDHLDRLPSVDDNDLEVVGITSYYTKDGKPSNRTANVRVQVEAKATTK